jgi:L-rhamnose mutarotase
LYNKIEEEEATQKWQKGMGKLYKGRHNKTILQNVRGRVKNEYTR